MPGITLAGGGALGLTTGQPLAQFSPGRVHVNIKDAPYSAAGDGSADDVAAFTSFRDWAALEQSDPLVLYIPQGDYILGSLVSLTATGVSDPPFEIIRDIIFWGYGASLSNAYLGGFTFSTPNGEVAKAQFETVSADSRSVVLINADDLSLFSVGDWVAPTGLEKQVSTLPPNYAYFEYKKISSIDVPTKTITFTEPLTYGYKSTWPLIDTLAVGIDGPATLQNMSTQRWDAELAFYGIRFKRSQQSYCPARKVSLIDCVFDWAFVPTQTKELLCRNCDLGSEEVEVDKLVELIHWIECRSHQVTFQSTSITRAIIEDHTFNGALNGTPKNLELRRTTGTAWHIGSGGYGWPETIEADAVEFSSVDLLKNTSLLSDFTQTGGVFSRAKTSGPVAWAVEGARIFLFSSDLTRIEGKAYTVTDITESGGNILVHTTLPDPLPTYSGFTSQPTRVGSAGVGSVAITNSTGCPELVEMSSAPEGSLFGEYYNRTLTAADFPTAAEATVFGRMVSYRINVTRAYTGAQSSCLLKASGENGAPYNDASYEGKQWDLVINLKVAGERVITQSGATGTQSGDSIPSDKDIWFRGSIAPYLATDMSGDTEGQKPIVTIEIIADQESFPGE